jgi:hypothetical protein
MRFESEAATEVYVNDAGGVSIKQTEGYGEECVVWFSPLRARLVAEALIRVAEEAEKANEE